MLESAHDNFIVPLESFRKVKTSRFLKYKFRVLKGIFGGYFKIKKCSEKIFHLFVKLSLFLAVARFGDPPKTGSVILRGTGSVLSLKPKTGKIIKKCIK